MNSGGQYSDNLRGAGEFHCSPMHAEVRYLPHHKKEEVLLRT